MSYWGQIIALEIAKWNSEHIISENHVSRYTKGHVEIEFLKLNSTHLYYLPTTFCSLLYSHTIFRLFSGIFFEAFSEDVTPSVSATEKISR